MAPRETGAPAALHSVANFWKVPGYRNICPVDSVGWVWLSEATDVMAGARGQRSCHSSWLWTPHLNRADLVPSHGHTS